MKNPLLKRKKKICLINLARKRRRLLSPNKSPRPNKGKKVHHLLLRKAKSLMIIAKMIS